MSRISNQDPEKQTILPDSHSPKEILLSQPEARADPTQSSIILSANKQIQRNANFQGNRPNPKAWRVLTSLISLLIILLLFLCTSTSKNEGQKPLTSALPFQQNDHTSKRMTVQTQNIVSQNKPAQTPTPNADSTEKKELVKQQTPNQEPVFTVQQAIENLQEQDSERYLQYSKANQRKADRLARAKRLKKEIVENNILKDIKKNPYLDDQYSYLTKEDLARVKKWRFIVGQDPTKPSSLADEEREYFVKKYNIDKYEELPFCIIIPTFNNKPRKRAERNIRSIIMQQYTNFHFKVIDDGSVDGTGQLISTYLASQNLVNSSRYEVQIHTSRMYSLRSIREAAKHFCKPQEIFMVVDGDDELLGRQVLKLFNAVFQQKKVWFMYTNFLGSIGKVGYSRPYHPNIIEQNLYRQYSFAVSHLRAYYTQLMLNIKDEDLQDENGNYFTSAGDMAVTVPCLQMAHTRIAYVPEMTYYYNFNTGMNVHRKRLNEQRQNNLKIRAKEKYEPLESLF